MLPHHVSYHDTPSGHRSVVPLILATEERDWHDSRLEYGDLSDKRHP